MLKFLYILFYLAQQVNLYSYMPRMYPFITGIKADYLISSHFIFIIKANAQGELKCDFLCCSIFERGDRDYETNQKARTLMKKERIHIPSNTTDILLDRLSAQTRPEDKTTDPSDNTEAKSDISQ